MRLLILLLLFALSFSQHVKVLYSNGKVEVVDSMKVKLELEDVRLRDLKVDGLTVEFKGPDRRRWYSFLQQGRPAPFFHQRQANRHGFEPSDFGNPSKSIGRICPLSLVVAIYCLL
jgi:hypothetical protein